MRESLKLLRKISLSTCLALALTVFNGCDGSPKTGTVTGMVTVDGEIPMNGASISFIPSDGKSAVAGATLKEGKYSVEVPLGMAKVQIRVPRPVAKAKPVNKEGPGAGPSGGTIVEESLPPEYHEKTKLTFDVQPGKNEKNWEVESKKN